ncbi:hypothetical protein A0H81_06833 [Grifola frondosa]|uniref:Uncharacterized protein n=1 Tax=Grifola frondosa TaxID=5627 RepID=A0A1C7M912_GRIFR|nr:hypothetical protein A0H81_06833 [Grifola frondosa]
MANLNSWMELISPKIKASCEISEESMLQNGAKYDKNNAISVQRHFQSAANVYVDMSFIRKMKDVAASRERPIDHYSFVNEDYPSRLPLTSPRLQRNGFGRLRLEMATSDSVHTSACSV